MTSFGALVVDDSPIMRKAIKDLLATVPGFDVVGEGGNGREAVELGRTYNPCLIVLDINMPIMGGLEALQVLKREIPGTAVVMVTSVLEPEIRNKAMQLGADACLQKGDEMWQGLRDIASRLCSTWKVAPGSG